MTFPVRVSAYGLRVAVFSIAFSIAFVFSVAQADDASDFTTDVQDAVRDASVDSSTFLARESLSHAEYTSSWDQFGTSALIEGSAPPSDITSAITEDVAASVASEQQYDQKEVAYLNTIRSSPEQVAAVEAKSGSDVPPGETLDPNPSLAENPDANATVAEDIAPEAVASAATESGTPSSDESAQTDASAGNTEHSAYEAVVIGDVPAGAMDQTSPDASSLGSDTSLDSAAAAIGASASSDDAGQASGANDTSGADDAGANDAGYSDTGPSDAGPAGDATSGDTGGSADPGLSANSPASAAIGAEHASKTLWVFLNALFGLFQKGL